MGQMIRKSDLVEGENSDIALMNLDEVLVLIAMQVGAPAQELINYAAEDKIGGYHINMTERAWPMGSMWGVEGQILYALTRWLKPLLIVEIGGWAGCSATHFATAIERNGFGHVVSVDNGVGGQEHGYLIPDNLRKYVDLVPMDGREFLNTVDAGKIGLIFEDADHSSELVAELSIAAAAKIAPGGIIANHDAGHECAYVGEPFYPIHSDVGQEVAKGLRIAGLFYKRYLAHPSDCGLAITKMPGTFTATKAETAIPQNQSGIAMIESEMIPPPKDEYLDHSGWKSELSVSQQVKPLPKPVARTGRKAK